MGGRFCATVGRLSVCLSHFAAAVAGLLLRAQQTGSVDRFLHGSAAAPLQQWQVNAGSVTLSADVGS